jgi:hypothetical protein
LLSQNDHAAGLAHGLNACCGLEDIMLQALAAKFNKLWTHPGFREKPLVVAGRGLGLAGTSCAAGRPWCS